MRAHQPVAAWLRRSGERGGSRPLPEGTAPLVVCNPPWIPAKATSPIEYAVYDPAGAMLKGFLTGVAAHLDDGEKRG